MFTAQVEDLNETTLEEIKRLLPKHYNELSEHRAEGIPLDPQYDLYLARSRAGQVIYITLREAGELVGYMVSFVVPGLHYRSCLTCTGDIFFVYPTKRGANHGRILFDAWIAECKRRGVRLMQVGIKTKHARFARRLVEAVGFAETEIMFWKFLDEEKS